MGAVRVTATAEDVERAKAAADAAWAAFWEAEHEYRQGRRKEWPAGLRQQAGKASEAFWTVYRQSHTRAEWDAKQAAGLTAVGRVADLWQAALAGLI